MGDSLSFEVQVKEHHKEMTTISDVHEHEQMDKEMKGSNLVVLLTAQHRDDVSPVSLYYLEKIPSLT